MKKCSQCGEEKPESAFNRCRGGLRSYCRDCGEKYEKRRERYKRRPLVRRVPARDGDVRQARRWVQRMIECGLLPSSKEAVCVDCNKSWDGVDKKTKVEYDHYLGYAPENHDKVQPRCVGCHKKIEKQRAEVPREEVF